MNISHAKTPLAVLWDFGGVILSYIDQAGAIGAWRAVVRAGGLRPLLVTVAVNRVFPPSSVSTAVTTDSVSGYGSKNSVNTTRPGGAISRYSP